MCNSFYVKQTLIKVPFRNKVKVVIIRIPFLSSQRALLISHFPLANIVSHEFLYLYTPPFKMQLPRAN